MFVRQPKDDSDINVQIKIVDFGYAAPDTDQELMSAPCFTPDYAPPDVLAQVGSEELRAALAFSHVSTNKAVKRKWTEDHHDGASAKKVAPYKHIVTQQPTCRYSAMAPEERRVKRRMAPVITRQRTPPEVLIKYNRSRDMWSLGVIVSMMLTGKCPYEILRDGEGPAKKMSDRILQGTVNLNSQAWKKVSNPAKNLVKSEF
jgi:serine/threonine protein kinase